MGKNKRKFKVKVETYLQEGGVVFLIKRIEIKGGQHVFGINKGEDIDNAITCSELISLMKENFGFEDGDKIDLKHEDYSIGFGE